MKKSYQGEFILAYKLFCPWQQALAETGLAPNFRFPGSLPISLVDIVEQTQGTGPHKFSLQHFHHMIWLKTALLFFVRWGAAMPVGSHFSLHFSRVFLWGFLVFYFLTRSGVCISFRDRSRRPKLFYVSLGMQYFTSIDN